MLMELYHTPPHRKIVECIWPLLLHMNNNGNQSNYYIDEIGVVQYLCWLYIPLRIHENLQRILKMYVAGLFSMSWPCAPGNINNVMDHMSHTRL